MRKDRFLYVNPRFCEVGGYTEEELLGRNPVEFLEPESVKTALAARDRIAAGDRHIAYRLRARRKDGATIVADVRGTLAPWDDKRALVAIVDDVTERAQAEERINDYVLRLEESMKTTLEAVSYMVDLRAPYTAGHERRAGLITAAIAREMGWTDDHFNKLELVGLVHDIGKIAVPAAARSRRWRRRAGKAAPAQPRWPAAAGTPTPRPCSACCRSWR